MNSTVAALRFFFTYTLDRPEISRKLIRVIQVLLGHAKLENTALYTRVATKTVRTVTSPLDRVVALMQERPGPGG